MVDKGQFTETRLADIKTVSAQTEDFVLEKSIFSNIFEKDIRRVYIYKKSERLAKAIYLIAPAFALSTSLRNRLDAIAVGLIDAAIAPPLSAKEAFSRELLALSSVLAIARSGGLLSSMNASLITDEAHALLAEIAVYEEPRIFLDDSPTLASLVKNSVKRVGKFVQQQTANTPSVRGGFVSGGKGHLSDIKDNNQRASAIISVIKDKGTVYIKDISTIIRDIGEKTIQRELQKLVSHGIVMKKGSRRWTAYSLT